MTRYTVKFTPARRQGLVKKQWEYKRGDLLCQITHIQHGKYGIYMYEKYGKSYECVGIEYTTNERDAKLIARDFVTS